jgi:nucleotide-binding universal stress UspA family protein
MKVEHILVPVDFSVCAKNAVKIAAQIAKKWRSKITLVHSCVMPATYATMGEPAMVPLVNSFKDEAKESLEALLKEIPELEEVECESEIMTSNFIDAVYTQIEAKGIDLVIMGTKGKHDSIEKMFGGHSIEVIRTANVPVLVVPENVTELRLEKIGFAVDAKSIMGLPLVAKFADMFAADIDIFYVGKEGENIDFEQGQIKNLFADQFEHLNYKFYNIHRNRVEKGIIEFAEEHKLDMLVMLPRDHDLMDMIFHKSVTKSIAMKIKIPILTIHE